LKSLLFHESRYKGRGGVQERRRSSEGKKTIEKGKGNWKLIDSSCDIATAKLKPHYPLLGREAQGREVCGPGWNLPRLRNPFGKRTRDALPAPGQERPYLLTKQENDYEYDSLRLREKSSKRKCSSRRIRASSLR